MDDRRRDALADTGAAAGDAGLLPGEERWATGGGAGVVAIDDIEPSGADADAWDREAHEAVPGRVLLDRSGASGGDNGAAEERAEAG